VALISLGKVPDILPMLGRQHAPVATPTIPAVIAESDTVPLGVPAPHQTSQSPASGAVDLGTIDTIYHDHSGKAPLRETPEEYRQRRAREAAPAPPPESTPQHPWHPFATCADFEFAELSLNASLSRKEIGDFLALLCRCQAGTDKITLHDYSHLRDTWNEAAHLLTPVCCCLYTSHLPHHSFRTFLL
jgi:hypothetical protein